MSSNTDVGQKVLNGLDNSQVSLGKFSASGLITILVVILGFILILYLGRLYIKSGKAKTHVKKASRKIKNILKRKRK